MLEACEFPVVAEAKDCANAPVVPAADASSAGRWIAISHVWAHGLGNPEANAILRCRYNWLMSQAHRISSAADYPIWLDTLCVPVGERYIKHREMAINQMRRVYEDAAFVLVLDSRLLSISGVNIVTCQLELLMCDWMQRLWTLQEGALPMPEKVVVAFKDCLLTLEQLTTCQHLREYTRINLEARLAEALQREFQFQDLVVQKESEDKRRDANESRMMALVQSMSHRSTSQLRDEAIVFANLLGFHFGLRSHMPTMETIYNSLTALPGEIIFRPGSRSPIPHLRSLPSSFLAQNQDRMIEAAGSTESKRTRWARVTDHGVVLKRPSLKLQVPQQITLENQIIVMCEGHSLCVVPTSKTLHEPGSSLPVTDIMINRLVYLRVPQAQNQDFDAVLVNIHGNHDEELDARFIGTAVMKRVVGEGANPSSPLSLLLSVITIAFVRRGMLAISARRGQCLCCSFRAQLAALSRQLQEGRRDYTSTTPLWREPLNSVRRRSEPSRHAKSSATPNRRPGRLSIRLFPEAISNRVRVCLESLKKRLASTKADSDSHLDQLAALDPDRIYWDGFKRRVEGIVAGSDETKTAEDDRLLAEIGRTQNSPEWRAELERALHYGFIDFVLLQKAQRDSGDMSVRPDLRYPTEWYTAARQIQRDVHLHIGPTNSGKTYNALKRLEESGSGFYAGPLRLLAHEVFSRFKAKGLSCDLVTGDDVRIDDDPNVTLSASTVEMVDVTTPVEVAVIDEVQMMASEDRGWAWTRAFLGANAKEVHLCGEARVLPLIRELTASTGDSLHVHEYKRLNPLKVMSKSLGGNLKNLRKGDCIVTFSVFSLHAMKKQIELDTGRRCAIVYGSLPPETRAQQAALFNDPDNDYDFLVASDAIGMGLNLSVKRIIFHGVVKYNGSYTEQLTVPQIKQIGGRAGRYRSSHQAMNNSEKSDSSTEVNVGLVTTLNDEDLPIVRDAMSAEDPPIRLAGLLPPGDFMEDMATRLPKGIPFEYILRRLCQSASIHRRFKLCNIRDQSRIAHIIEPVRGLTIAQRIVLTAAPGYSSSHDVTMAMKVLAQIIAEQRQVTVVDIAEINLEVLEKPISGDREYLQSLEDLHKTLILFLWLSYRFIGTFKDRDMAMYAKEMVEDRINTCLREFSANPELRKRVLAYKKRMDFSKIPTHGAVATNLDFPGNQDSALPLEWTRGPEEAGFEEAQSAQASVTAHA
ncbi:hypothetical protein A1O3_04961 [Capronia epimyces CBS 606.96]|uniref:ATP-dependent RNA helicase SUV3, mitochondrial n=1 Tax=Capronia epimyces CBS 606.96 TaxID=1182542 RepID=W9YPW0_9EURO|nr:uncharacterized protein A1O3_04961 [Capronia epimyces CBS 606.96]EXJ84294.1 hypothetical protein A1O3_04961 [Capronia epimyces CBS 606.96]